jgi:AraC family transcriptional regulator of arabinose operon
MHKLLIHQAALHRCRPDWKWDTTNTIFNDIDLWYVKDGKGKLEFDDIQLNIYKGLCLLLPGGRIYKGEHDIYNPLTVINCHFDYVDYSGQIIPPLTCMTQPKIRFISNRLFFESILFRLLEAVRQQKESQAALWLSAGLEEFDREKEKTIRNDSKHSLIKQFCEHTHIHPHQNYGEILNHLNCDFSTDYFTRLFKQYMDISPQAYIINNRIEAAKTLLLNSNYTVQECADLLGYSDVHFFSRQFKKMTKEAPTAYRRKDDSTK